jgi:hypothetical protein
LDESKKHLKVVEDNIEQNMKECEQAGDLRAKNEEHVLFLMKIS